MAKKRKSMTNGAVDTLLREQQTTTLRERRAVDRQPFVRPVEIIHVRAGATQSGVSRDVSRHGISVLTPDPLTPGAIAMLHVHSIFGRPLEVRAQVRWCDSFGDGWFASGWYFLESE
jgi:hypothetical protein